MDYGFTAQMEDWLDDVSRGERNWVAMLREFYAPFSKALQEAKEKMQGTGGKGVRNKETSKQGRKVTANMPVEGVVCPECGAPMVERTSKYGRFLGCSKYPACTGKRKV
jgi:DNA topoisomerase-1